MKVTVTIDGMMCGMCESHIKDSIRKAIPDANKVNASHSKGEATFELPNEMPQAMVEHELHAAIDPTGYKVLSVKLGEDEPKKRRGLFGRK